MLVYFEKVTFSLTILLYRGKTRAVEEAAMSLKRIKRRLSLTFRGSRGVDESLSELAESLTVEENGAIKENGEYKYRLVKGRNC